jgi:hypothetical protein
MPQLTPLETLVMRAFEAQSQQDGSSLVSWLWWAVGRQGTRTASGRGHVGGDEEKRAAGHRRPWVVSIAGLPRLAR